MNHVVYIIVAFALWNLITFSLYGIDKRRATRKQWRISESTLIVCAFLMGGIGAFLGMWLFRHKTKYLKFKVLIPLAIIANVAVVILLNHAIAIFEYML